MKLPYRVTKLTLKRDAPTWYWFAERNGFGGWRYIGRKGDKRVVIMPFAILSGYNGDDFATEWRVDTGEKSMSYSAWVLLEGMHP